MTRLPFKENRLSAEDGEIILLDRKYPPNNRVVVSICLAAGIFAAFAGLQRGGSAIWAVFEGSTVFLVGLLISRPTYYWWSKQLWVPTTLLANVDWLQGYVQRATPLSNFLTETPLQIAWDQVRRAAISHRPWVFATDKVELDVVMRDATQLTFRVPRLVGSEKQELGEVLGAIGIRHGFDVVIMPETEKPRIWFP